MFRNPFYYGVFVYNGVMHQGLHLPLITKATFDKIQAALVTVGKPRKKRGEKGFQFLNFATCGSCGYCITGERHTKKSGRRYYYYRCTHKNKRQHCDDRRSIRQDEFSEEVKRNTSLATIPDEWKERFLARIETWESETSHEKQAQIDRLKADLTVIKGKIDRINNGFADGALNPQEFKELKNPLVPRKTELEQQIVALERSKTNRLEPLRNFVIEANQAEILVKTGNWLEMKSFLQKVGSHRILRAQTLTVTFTKPFDLLGSNRSRSATHHE